MARNIQSDEKQGPTTKISLPSKAIIQNLRTDKVFLRQEKAKGVNYHLNNIYEMLKGLLKEKIKI